MPKARNRRRGARPWTAFKLGCDLRSLGGTPARPPEFILDLRNQGEKKPYQCRVPNFCMIEWDGKWHR